MAVGRRGQGSVEFLMTYGWALLIILAVLVVMWQWGLFNLGGRVEPGSFGFWGVVAEDGILDQDGVLKLSLLNGVGANVTITKCNATIYAKSIVCEPCTDNTIEDPFSGNKICVIQPGKRGTLTLQDNKWRDSPGQRWEAEVWFTYSDVRTGAATYQSSGRVWNAVEV